MEHKFIIPGVLPHLNEYTRQLNISKFRGSDLKRTTERLISLHIKAQLKDVKFSDAVHIRITWVEPNQKRDKDNIAFAKKFIFDALVSCGVLKNDGWAQIDGFSDSFLVDSDNPRVEVVLNETW